MPYDCFLSYASPDLPHAEEVHRRLTLAGFTVWFDKARLRPGFDWHREIEEGCEESRVLLPLLTPRWKLSDWTRYETYGAEAVIPILAEGAWADISTPPLRRFQNHAVPLDAAGDADWERLFAAIHEMLAREAPQKPRRVAHLRFRPNPYFVGREETLNEIHEKLFTNRTAALTQGHAEAITALGGVGKTTLARQYAEKFWRCYRQMFWVDCVKSLDSEFAAIHDVLRPEPTYQALKDADKAAWVRGEFNQTAGRPLRLLILDNAGNEDSVLPWIPRTGNCHTTITSRFTGWSAGIENCPVRVLPPDPARELLLRRADRSAEREGTVCDAVAKKLGYLPLALEQAGAYVREQGPGFPFAQYLRLYEENERKFLDRNAPGTTEYPDSVFLTWRATIDKLPAGARAMLRLCSFLASTPIPVAMFVKGAGIVAEEARRIGGGETEEAGEFETLEWKAALARYSMINLEAGDSFSVHGLVQAVERHQVDESERPGLVEKAVDLLAGWAPEAAYEYENWPVWRAALPHAESLWEWQRDDGRVRLNARFLGSLGAFQLSQGAYAAAELPMRRALAARERVLGAEHPDTLGSVNNLALLLERKGDYGEAEPLCRRAREVIERVLGAEHPGTLRCANDLGFLLAKMGKYDEAEMLDRRVLEARERVLGTEHPDTIVSVNNLAGILYRKGEYGAAEPLQRRALEASERVLGPEHPQTLGCVSNLAGLYRRWIEVRRRVLGPEHPDTLATAAALSQVEQRKERP
ncbi:MAG: tetratricopeptide repeat protein [Bryobacterales bacterium]|nr:tetratricopeptide repeat protein [Bryobacterales bacterium]